MSKVTEIRAKIAQLISSTQLAFNAGSERGVHVGDKVTLFRVVEINDPETKEPLGAVEVPRLNLKVSSVDNKFCVADVTDVDPESRMTSIYVGTLSTKKVTLTPQPRTVFGSDNTVTVRIGEDAVISHTTD